MRLYHLTWACHVESILRDGLIPSHRPNKFAFKAAVERSKGKLFLCRKSRKDYWLMTYQEGWVEEPNDNKDERLVWIVVNCQGLDLKPDESSENDDYTGDFYSRTTIPPDRIERIIRIRKGYRP